MKINTTIDTDRLISVIAQDYFDIGCAEALGKMKRVKRLESKLTGRIHVLNMMLDWEVMNEICSKAHKRADREYQYWCNARGMHREAELGL